LRYCVLRRPAVATAQLVGRLLAFLYAASAGICLISYFLAWQSGHPLSRWLIMIYVACLVGSPLLLRLRMDRYGLVIATTMTGTALVSLVVHLMGDARTAAWAASLYLLIIIPCFYLYSRSVAWVHGLFVGAVALLVLRGNDAVGPTELVMGFGVAAVLTVAVSWLVRAADLAEVDYVTGLPNRRGFEISTQLALRENEAGVQMALVGIDLDAFRAVNDKIGSAAGDAQLHSLARRWQTVLPEGAVLARHGSDEFTLLIRPATVEGVDRTLVAMREVAGDLTFSAGVAWTTSADTRSESLTMLKLRADSAVYEAKRQGPSRTVIAAPSRTARTGRQIRDALAGGEFVLYYQPIINLHTCVVDKAEALVRWQHPVDGLVLPDGFLGAAEQSGTMVELGDWIVATACRDAAAWTPNAQGRDVCLSINASGAELQDPTYATRVLNHAATAGLSVGRIVIELVETDYNINSSVVRANLAALTAAGVGLAIDDFGTGYSNLSRLDQMHIQVLKIDRSFVRTLTRADQEMPVISAILAMGCALRMQIVAEGVETPIQAAWLRRRGCSHAQGYLYGKPAPNAPVNQSGPGLAAR
jgi:diguanylate cyclase (GGDEF)-like protein